jgi:predicted transcriptional regulator
LLKSKQKVVFSPCASFLIAELLIYVRLRIEVGVGTMADAEQNAHVAQILSSYLSNNTVAPTDLPGVIESVKRAFGGHAGEPASSSSGEAHKTWEPAVPVKKSVTPDAVTCLCCGETFKSLKRHLETAHQLDPAAYRAAFNLKPDHPLVAPNYAARRSELAKSLGLGRKPKVEEPAKGRAKTPKTARAAA